MAKIALSVMPDVQQQQQRAVCFDVETTGLVPGVDRVHGLGIKWADDPTPARYYRLEELPDEWKAALADPTVAKLNQNVRFDVKHLRAAGLKVEGEFRCTMVGQHCLNENRPLGLESLVEFHLGPGRLEGYHKLLDVLEKEKLRHVGQLCARDLVDPARPYEALLKAYGGEDVDNAAAVWEVLDRKHHEVDTQLRAACGAVKTPRDYLQEEAFPTEALLAEIELKGIRCDLGRLEETRRHLADQRGQLVEKMLSLVGAEVRAIEEALAEKEQAKVMKPAAKARRQPGKRGNNWNCSFLWTSGAHLARLLFEKLGESPHRTDAGNYCTDDEVLRTIKETTQQPRVAELCGLLQEYRNNAKNLQTYVGDATRGTLALVRAGGTGGPEPRFYPSYDPRIVTGRLGSFAHTFPRDFDITRAFIPDPGHTFVYFDYAAIELRIAAHLSRDPKMVSWFSADVDPHCATASALFGEEVKKDDPRRQVGKQVNFLLIYDGSKWRLQQALEEAGLKYSLEECDVFRTKFFQAHPGYRRHMDQLLRDAHKRGWVLAESGRLRRLPELAYRGSLDWDRHVFNGTSQQLGAVGGRSPKEAFDNAVKAYKHAKKQALNFPIQSAGATLTKRACIEAWKRGYQLVYTKHDCAVFQVTTEAVASAVRELREIAEGTVKLSVPLRADFKVLNSLFEGDRNKTLEKEVGL